MVIDLTRFVRSSILWCMQCRFSLTVNKENEIKCKNTAILFNSQNGLVLNQSNQALNSSLQSHFCKLNECESWVQRHWNRQRSRWIDGDVVKTRQKREIVTKVKQATNDGRFQLHSAILYWITFIEWEQENRIWFTVSVPPRLLPPLTLSSTRDNKWNKTTTQMAKQRTCRVICWKMCPLHSITSIAPIEATIEYIDFIKCDIENIGPMRLTLIYVAALSMPWCNKSPNTKIPIDRENILKKCEKVSLYR